MLMGSIESMDSLTLLFVVTTGIGTEDGSVSLGLVFVLVPMLASEGVGLTDAVENK